MRNSVLLLLVASLATVSASRLFSDDLSTLAARQLRQTTTGSVYAVCPDNCDVNNGKCTFDSSNAGYKCTQCVNNLVVVKGRCACPAGRYLDVANSRCVDCPLGSWCPGGIYDQAQPNTADNLNQPISTACTNGLITRAKRSRARTQCLNPPGNYYSAVNVTGPVNYTCTATEPCAITCPADTFSPGLAKQKACTPCPTGFKTNGGTGKTTSQSCMVPPGYYLKTPGQVAACPQGEYQDSYVPPSTGVGKCTPCGVGITTSVANAADNRNLCKHTQAGYVALTASTSGPTLNYITAATKCPQNFYCPGGLVSATMDTGNPGAAQKMFACSVGGVDGLWTQDVGATSVDECMVPPGYGKADGSSVAITQCTDGATGQYRDGWLPGNQVNTAAAVCATCGANINGTRNDELIVYTWNSTAGAYDSAVTNVASSSGNCFIEAGMGMYYIAGSQNSLSSYRASVCTRTLAQYGVASRTYGLAANPCKPCSTGLEITSTSASGHTDPASGGIIDAAACVTKPGWGWDGRISTECPKGSWAVGGDLSPCTECGFGLTTVGTATNASASCLLAEGYGSVSGVLQLCPIGTYNDQDGVLANTTACSACPGSKTSTEVGAVNSTTDCDACPAGKGAPGPLASNFTSGSCSACTSGTYGPNRRSVDEQADQSCQACPTSTTGFQFYYKGTAYPYVAQPVSKASATVAGDCLSDYAQITDGLWYFADGLNDPQSGATAGDADITACAAECSKEANCQFITYDYNATVSKCKLYSASGSGAILAYKAVPSGDIYAAAQSVGKVGAKSATPSGLYTQWNVASTAFTKPGTVTAGTGTASKEACFNECDADAECAAVYFISGSECSLLKGVSTPGIATAAKRSLTRAIPAQAY